ncbi:hypothetical protein NSB04_19845 [Blautia pseudococcoides]|nr:hypothetical protein [Blautia pseudococcoides]
MARPRSIESIETEIQKTTEELEKGQSKVNVLSERLLDLQNQKQAFEAKQVMNAFKKSDRTLQELLTFLGE